MSDESERTTVSAESGGKYVDFVLVWNEHRWTSDEQTELADFPYVAEVAGKRYELYGDGTFDEEELTPQEERAVGP